MGWQPEAPVTQRITCAMLDRAWPTVASVRVRTPLPRGWRTPGATATREVVMTMTERTNTTSLNDQTGESGPVQPCTTGADPHP